MLKRSWSILFLFLVYYAGGQQLAQYRYWYDTNFGTATTINSSSSTASLNLDVNNLSLGFHRLNFQSKDTNGLWSSVSTSSFVKVASTSVNSRYRFWYDNDFGSALVVNSPDTLVSLLLDVASLSAGFHRLNFQSQDNHGSWSSVSTSSFLRAPTSNANSKYRYWYDNNFGSCITSSSSDTIINLSLTVTNLSTGYHRLNFQSQDSLGNWSSVVTQHFVRANATNALKSFKYWFDESLAGSKTILIGSAFVNDFIANINLDGLTNGVHELNYKFFDEQKQWSSIITDTILKGPIQAISFNFPLIYLKKTQIQSGDADSVWGSRFTPLGECDIEIKPSNQQTVITKTTISSDINGKIHFNYSFISTLQPGIYDIIATDKTTNLASYKVRLAIGNTNTITGGSIKITNPSPQSTGKLSEPITLAWTDKLSNRNNLIDNTGKIRVTYKIEYNRNNTGWQVTALKTDAGFAQKTSSFSFNFPPGQEGSYVFRVSDLNELSNTDTSASMVIKSDPNDVEMSYLWADASGANPSESPLGVAADGTARIYIKIAKKVGNNKTISSIQLTAIDSSNLSITNNQLLGKVAGFSGTNIETYSTEANSAVLPSISSSHIQEDGSVIFWYVAPTDFARGSFDYNASSRKINIVAKVFYTDNSTGKVSETVEIVRPPLMLIHGIGGDERTWDEFSYSDNGSKYFFSSSSPNLPHTQLWKYAAAVNMYPNASFAQNAQLLLNLTASGMYNTTVDQFGAYKNPSFQFFLLQMRKKRYAANRVDCITHSMGGSMVRTAINLYSTHYKPADTDPRTFKNYNNGFINKLITLNTPHNGSPIADFFIDKGKTFLGKRFLETLWRLPFNGVDNLILSAFNSNLSGHPDFNNPTDALKNLRFNNEGIKFHATHVKNHLIGGDILEGSTECSILYSISQKSWTLIGLNTLFAAFGETDCQGVDHLFTSYGVTDYLENGDGVVPLQSQLPGKDISESGTDHTIVYGMSNAFHTDITASEQAGQRTFNLLNSSIEGSDFSSTIAANASGGTTYYKTFSTPPSEWFDTSKIEILTPDRFGSLAIDSTIKINIAVKDSINFKYVTLVFQDKVYTSTSKVQNQTFEAQVNPYLVDIQQIVASSVYDSSGTDVYYTDTLSVVVSQDTLLRSFYAFPKAKYLNTGQRFTPTYNLVHETYISNIPINDTALHISVADPAVVVYSPSLSSFIGQDTGSTYAIIKYKSYVDTVIFIIDTFSIANVALPVTLISFTGQATSDFNVLRWKAAGDELFSHFILQASINTNDWRGISRVNSLPGADINSYRYNDSASAKEHVIYYRLLMYDKDGRYKISNIVVIRRGATNSEMRVFPNPVTKKEVFIDFGSKVTSSEVVITIVDPTGKAVKTVTQIIDGNNLMRIDLRGLKPSVYLFRVRRGDHIQAVKVIVAE